MNYQVMPPLSDADYQALKCDIDAAGVLIPVEYDEDGNILDGHHRVKICAELGITDWPKFTRKGLSEEGKFAHARQLNIARRHINQAQKRELIADQLKATPHLADTVIAGMLGVDHKTVEKVRAGLVSTWEIPKLDKTVGKDGKARRKPEHRPASTAYVDDTPEGQKEAVSAGNKVRREKKEAAKEQRDKDNAELAALCSATTAEYQLFNEPCIHALNGDAGSMDWVITDPPYPKEYLHLYTVLSEVAAHVLRDGGSLLCMAGHSYLPNVITALSKSLTYHWTLAYLVPGGQATQIFPRKVNTFWKPVLWFVKGKYEGLWVGDVATSDVNDNDKTRHHWGQSESGMADLMGRFVKPGDKVLDPFMGAGTTGVVALDIGADFVGYDNDEMAFNETVVRLDRASLEQ